MRRWIRAGRLRATRLGTQDFIEPSDLPLRERPIPRPAWMRRTATGEPMPDVVAILRRQRTERLLMPVVDASFAVEASLAPGR